ncbi:hypothetical protein [Citrobacter pasteurii]|nr:hypothetical protein SF123566_0251 [Shigella flexneri 1235-66]CEJ63129.1 hypothetical protein [Citrobacter pasteurii]
MWCYTVLEHPQFVERLSVRGRKVDVPLTGNSVDLGAQMS